MKIALGQDQVHIKFASISILVLNINMIYIVKFPVNYRHTVNIQIDYICIEMI